MEITATITWGDAGEITVCCSDEQPYNPEVANDLANRAVTSLLDAYRQMLAEAKA